MKIRWAALLGCVLMLATIAAVGPTVAASSVTVIVRPGDDPEAVTRAIQAANRAGQDVVLRLDDAVMPVGAAAESVAAGPSLLDAFRLGLARGIQRIPSIPGLLDAAARAWNTSANATGLRALGLVLAVVGIALAVAFLLRGVGRRLLGARLVPASDDFADRLASASALVVLDLAALVVFVVAGHTALDVVLPLADFVRTVGLTTLDRVTTLAFYVIGGRFLLAPGEPHRRLLPLPRAEWHFRILMIYGVSGQILLETLTLSRQIAVDAASVTGWLLIAGTAIMLLKLWWFWQGRRDVASVILGDGNAQPGFLRRVAAIGLPWLNIVVAVMIWVIAIMTATSLDGVRWGAPAGLTQILVIVLPILGGGIGRLTESLTQRALTRRTPKPITLALIGVARTIVTGAAWIVSLVILGNLWGDYLVDASSAVAQTALKTFTGAAAALIVGWVVWAFLRAYFDVYAPERRAAMPGEEEEKETQAAGRLETVLPLLRGVAFGAVASVTALVVLARLGVEIGPFLAGFGVIGLAISFGSQALVRDIVSGIFFMADDAFRAGEYIDTGRLRGTVEKITLRSVQLRHQNGQIHTVPFGQLQATTNFSRDWATIKFTLRLDRDADIEKARKAAKRVGQQMLEDPELGPEFIVPLKMQGVQEITDTAIVIRLKFTCKPTKPTWLQREALKRVYREFQTAGIPLASNAVTVKGGTSDEAAAAGASVAMPGSTP